MMATIVPPEIRLEVRGLTPEQTERALCKYYIGSYANELQTNVHNMSEARIQIAEEMIAHYTKRLFAIGEA